MYEYKCKTLRIVDGDTVDVDIDLGFGIWRHRERVRLVDIDTPESRTRDLVEKKFGLAAKEFVRFMMPVGSAQTITTQKDKTGKFGRILGDFKIWDKEKDETKSLTQIMLDNHHAVVYTGSSKEEIKEAHLANRKWLIEAGQVKLED